VSIKQRSHQLPALPTERKPQRQAAVRLPPERVQQLQILKEKLNMASIADTIGHLIRKEFEAEGLRPTIPGVRVVRQNENILFGFEHAEITMTQDEAAFVTREIRIRAEPSSDSVSRRALNSAVELVTPEHNFGLRPLAITKKGTGINIRIRSQMKSFAPSVGRNWLI
jgi:hypothetical protein